MNLTANQIVAHKLRRARGLRGWTQETAAQRLEPFLGTRWSKATFSAAERSIAQPHRIRQFSADELVAFAAAFELPVPYFLQPPAEMTEARVPGASKGLDVARMREFAGMPPLRYEDAAWEKTLNDLEASGIDVTRLQRKEDHQ